jgi:hypothetical protein
MHHSGMESRRCDELHLMQQGELIRELEAHPQPRFDLKVNDVHVTNYIADFAYHDAETGERVVEDVKGMSTAEYRIKKALMLACLGIEVREVRRVRGR